MRKAWRFWIIGICLMILCIWSFVSYQDEMNTYMGVEILKEEEKMQLQEELEIDLSEFITYDKEKASVDSKTKTIYVTANIEKGTMIGDIKSKLNIILQDYTLYFVEDDHFNDLYETVQNSYKFELMAVNQDKDYVCYDVIFTTLPVISIDGEYSYTNEDNRDVLYGEFILWNPYDSEIGQHTVKSSYAEWNVRGRSAAGFPKKSWKLSLKNSKGHNRDISLLGLGEDDDWILNPLYKDNTKIREKLMMDLWNTMVDETSYNKKMSTGEYVELVMNGEYQGLYFLQRRIDRKYLNLSDKDVLFKAGKTNLPENVTDAYEIEYTSLPIPDTYGLLDGLYRRKDYSQIVLDNFIDITLFMNFGVALDNVGYVNVFYVFENVTNDRYKISYVFWDTDMSFGLRWIDDFSYDVEWTKDYIVNRQEYDDMKMLYPELDKMLEERWIELRKTILNESNILQVLKKHEEKIINSGALMRDRELWGLYTSTEDTIENLHSFIEYRLQFLDKYYIGM